MQEVSSSLSFKRETYQQSVSIMDRFFQQVPLIPKNKIQLVGATALVLAHKMEVTITCFKLIQLSIFVCCNKGSKILNSDTLIFLLINPLFILYPQGSAHLENRGFHYGLQLWVYPRAVPRNGAAHMAGNNQIFQNSFGLHFKITLIQKQKRITLFLLFLLIRHCNTAWVALLDISGWTSLCLSGMSSVSNSNSCSKTILSFSEKTRKNPFECSLPFASIWTVYCWIFRATLIAGIP